MTDRVLAQGGAAWTALRRMVREILARKPGGHLIEGRLPDLVLSLPVHLRERDDDPAEFALVLASEIERQIDDAIEAAGAFQPGHAFCHRCGAALCDHSRPPSSRHVFIGYAATGAPFWSEFSQHLLTLRHPEVDRLFDEPVAFITLLLGRAEMHSALLPTFRSGGRELIGQVIAGFFTLPARPGEGRSVMALTLQAVASGAPGGRLRLGLNLLGTAPDGQDLDVIWDRQNDLPWRRAVRWAQAALVGAAADGAGRRPPATGVREGDDGSAAAVLFVSDRLERRVMAILQGLARRLEQDVKGRSRRTRHAGERHEGGERPTRKAQDDVGAARLDSFLRDERSGAVVVLGDRGRTHFFSPEGRLVSSARYSRDAVERKRRAGLWRPLPADEARKVRDALRRADRSER